MTDSEQSADLPQRDYAQQIVNAVSHDLKNPTRQIKSFLQILQSHAGDDLDEKGRHYLDLVLKAADTLQAKLDALTLLSRASTSDLLVEPCDASEVVEEVLSSLSGSIESAKASVDLDITGKVLADQPKLASVLTELISNSLKFCREGATISISAKATGNQCLFSVADSGPGFDARDFTTPFDLFRRFHLDDYEGTGTGLTVVRTLLARMGATPEIESSPDGGTTVRFSLPLA